MDLRVRIVIRRTLLDGCVLVGNSAPPPFYIAPFLQARGVTEQEEFLINPFGLLYSEVTASSLVRVNNEGVILDPGSTRLGVNRPGVEIHSAIYGARRDVKCIMHLHTVAGAAVQTTTPAREICLN